MESSNVAQIPARNATHIQQRSFTEGHEREAEFLSLRLLSKRGRVRLSARPIDYSRLPGKSSLLAVGNQKGCLAAAVRAEEGNFILLSTLSEFRTVVESGQPEPEPFIPFTPQQSLLRVPGSPNIIKFALHDERLIIGFVEGPILVYSTNDLYASTRTQPDPIHVFPGDASTIPRDIAPNPGESPELVAILRGVHGQEPGHQVDVLDIQQLKHVAGWRKGNDLNMAPVSISWSPKGKQIAIGLQSGDILSYSPLSSGSPKSHLPRPPSIPATASSLLSTTWLTNASFHAIFSSPEASSSLFDTSKSSSLTKTHIISTYDSKSQSVIDVGLQDPSPPFGAQFPPGPLSIVLRNWSPAKFIVICGDGPSPDIGIIGSMSLDVSPDVWVNFTLEETSTPSLPLGEDTQDMALLGLEIDLTSSKPVRIAEQPDDGAPDLPPSPILYAYMSDGTVVAWHVLNTTGSSFPGMATANATEAPTTSTQLMTQQRMSMEESGMSSPRISPHASPKPTSLPPSSLSQPVSPFGQTPSSPSTSTSISPAQGFGAFGIVNTTSKFGSTGFGFAGSAPSSFGTPSAPSAFDSSAFGGGSNTKTLPAPPAFGSPGFGQSSAASVFGAPGFGSNPTVPAFGKSDFAPPGSSGTTSISSTGGFAAFASQGTSAFGASVGSAFSSGSKPTQSSPFGMAVSPSGPQSAFGAGGSGQGAAAPTSVFGDGHSGPTMFGQHRPVVSSAFGQAAAAPAFGAPSFGKTAAPAFGQSGFSPSSLPRSSISSTGGFAAFANQGISGFGTPIGSEFSSDSKPTQGSSFGTASSPSGHQSAFGAGATGQANAAPVSAFGAGGSGQATAPLTPAFGAGGSGKGNTALQSAFGTEGFEPASSFNQPQQRSVQPSSSFGSFGIKAATPAFGHTSFGNNKSSATPQGGAFNNLGVLGDSLTSSKPPDLARFDSPPGSPPSPGESQPSSPKHPSTSSQPTKPASSYLKPAEGFGAFVKSSGAFGSPKPIAPGAFGSSSQQKSPSPQLKPLVPVSGSTTSGPSTISSSTATPTFGTTSTLGGNKLVFGTSTFGAVPQTATSELSKPITGGGFGAFSSGGGGFASFANSAKSTSFDDIISSSNQDKPKSTNTPLAFGIASNAKLSKVSVFKTPTEQVTNFTAGKSIDSVSTTRNSDIGIADSDAKNVTNKEPSPGASKINQEPSSSVDIGQDSSFSLLSLREAASQVKLSPVTQTVGSPPKSLKEGVSAETEEENNAREGVDDAASEPFSLTDDGLHESASNSSPRSPSRSLSDEEPELPENIPLLTDDGLHESASNSSPRSPSRSLSDEEPELPENIPLPETPTPRSTPVSILTPLPSPPKLSVADASPSVPTPSSYVSAVERSNTTTPLGSPDKPAGPMSTPLSPKPLFPTSTVSLLGLGLGRPSSRPIRSSPLASAPITSTDEEDVASDVTPSKSAPAIVNIKAAETKAQLRQLSSPTQIPLTELPTDSGNAASSSVNRRPKTPPLLGTPLTTGAGSTTLRSSFVLDQPQAVPVPLKTSTPPVPLSSPNSVKNPTASPPREEEEEAEELPKHPLQIEFQRAYQEMVRELVQLYKKSQDMALIRPAISVPRGLDKLVLNNQDFIPGKYSHGDLSSFAIMIGSLQKKVISLLDQGQSSKGCLQDLQNLALISSTKLEELSRWTRAREDPEFAKTLKPQALGPEHSENQIRLRKSLQIAHDRIQKCEDELESLKKRLEQYKSGKVGLRPPSLDTIDRTCRNIQVALEERTKLLEQLNDRIDALSPQTLQRLYSSSTRMRTSYQKPGTVTPPFASVAAAALNSERSSLKLKNALLSARKEPLLTTDIVKLETSKRASLAPQGTPQIPRPEWKLPPVPPLSTPSGSVNRRSARPGKRHGAVQLKATTLGSDAKSAAFDWGPLPGVAPMDQLSQDVRSQRTTSSIKLTMQELDDDGEWEEAAEDYERHR